jgi:hypothetical protein
MIGQIQRRERDLFTKAFTTGVIVVILGVVGYYLWLEHGPSEAEAESGRPEPVKLTGILYSENDASVVIDSKIVREGETINGVKVVKINRNDVELEKDGIRWKQQVAQPESKKQRTK